MFVFIICQAGWKWGRCLACFGQKKFLGIESILGIKLSARSNVVNIVKGSLPPPILRSFGLKSKIFIGEYQMCMPHLLQTHHDPTMSPKHAGTWITKAAYYKIHLKSGISHSNIVCEMLLEILHYSVFDIETNLHSLQNIGYLAIHSRCSYVH